MVSEWKKSMTKVSKKRIYLCIYHEKLTKFSLKQFKIFFATDIIAAAPAAKKKKTFGFFFLAS